MLPKLALCNFIEDVDTLKDLASRNGFEGVDWTFTLESLPRTAHQEQALRERIARLHPLEVRYHCAFREADPGDMDASRATDAQEILRSACRLVSRLRGKYMTIHMGLGRDSMENLHWERTLACLRNLVAYGRGLGVVVCLENLADGWSSRPELFERLIRKSGAGVTIDIGHARVCPSVECRYYSFEDFVLPHENRVFNAHIYHEERNDKHLPPGQVRDVAERLELLMGLPCDWWVLELREEAPLMATLEIIREFFQSRTPLTQSMETEALRKNHTTSAPLVVPFSVVQTVRPLQAVHLPS